MSRCPCTPVKLTFLPISIENPLDTGTKEVKFVSEELAQYRHHIISAKKIGKALLQGVPENSPFHRSITAAQETLYYINSVGRAVHPANGSSFLVNRSSFFSSAPEYQPPSKVRIVSSTKTRAQIQTEKQHLDEEATFESPRPKHNLMKLCPPHQKLNNLNQEVVTMILYLQSNKTCTPSMMCIMWTSTIPCITLRLMYHYAPLRTHVIVAGDVTVKLNLKLTLTGDMQMEYMSV